ncbi:ankyrin repeat-containing domain protein [Trichoderma longibrachiatum]
MGVLDISKDYKPDEKELQKEYPNQIDDITNLFKAIDNKQVDQISKIVAAGLVSPDAPNNQGETPLIAAVTSNDPAMIRTLVSLGATVNGYGLYCEDDSRTKAQRTPLQVAAAQGKLGIVKILRDLGADDSLVAPDGAIALRLAAENGHREVVEYLPARRGGAWKRWKTTHGKQMQRVRRILEKIGSVLKFFVWTVPKFLLWTIPKRVVTTVPKAVFVTLPKELYERRHKIGPWCKRQIYKFPSRVKKLANHAHDGIKKAGKVIEKTPGKIWEVMKRMPGALRLIMSWIGRGSCNIGNAAFDVLKRVVSLIHTTTEAVIGFFRAVTLADVANGFRAVLRAVFIDFPKAAAWLVTTVGKTAYQVLESVLGTLGKVIFYAVALLIRLVGWLPQKTWEMLLACGRSVGKGVEEVLVCINPKRI